MSKVLEGVVTMPLAGSFSADWEAAAEPCNEFLKLHLIVCNWRELQLIKHNEIIESRPARSVQMSEFGPTQMTPGPQTGTEKPISCQKFVPTHHLRNLSQKCDFAVSYHFLVDFSYLQVIMREKLCKS